MLPFSPAAIASLAAVFGTFWFLGSYGWLRSFGQGLQRSWQEWATVTVITLAGLAVYWPYWHDGLLGAGDYYHYGLQAADASFQLRHGVWPIMVGQSEYAFNGNIHTLRTAPYFTHFAAIVNLIAGGKLEPWQLTNVIILLTGAATAWSAYLAIRWLAPSGRIVPAGLALIYICTPAITALVFFADMVATFMAAPWLPLVWASAVKIVEGSSRRAWLFLAISLGMIWLSHPPVAIWITPIAGLAVAIGLVRKNLPTHLWPFIVAAALLAASLAGYVVYSVQSLDLAEPVRDANAYRGIAYFLAAAWPHAVLPLDIVGGGMGSIQLGYTLLSVLIAATSLSFVFRRKLAVGYCAGSIVLLLVWILPIPKFEENLWKLVPDAVLAITNQWPMQRIYPIAAAGIVVWAGLMSRLVFERRHQPSLLLAGGFCVGLLWSGYELSKFQRIAIGQTREQSALAYDPRSFKLTRSSYALFDFTPGYYSHGWMDPESEMRLLDTRETPVWSNALSIQKSATGTSVAPLPIGLAFTLPSSPETDYLLEFTFPSPGIAGEVTLRGTDIYRNYTLPTYGNPLSFGTDRPNEHTLRLRAGATGSTAGPFTITAPVGTQVRAIRYLRSELPFQIQSQFPFLLSVSAPQAGLVETPQVFVPGYDAWVNGQLEIPLRSPQGLLEIEVPAGKSVVKLRYSGPPFLRALGWVCTLAAVISLILLMRGPEIEAIPSVTPRAEVSIGHRLIVPLLAAASASVLVLGFIDRHARTPKIDRQGNLKLSVKFPRRPDNPVEPLVVTGKTGAADSVYVIYEGLHLRFGIDHWALGGPVSDPVKIDRQLVHVLEYSSAALKAQPAAGGISAVVLRLDGKEILNASLPTYPADENERYIGSNPVDSSACSQRFSGQIAGSK